MNPFYYLVLFLALMPAQRYYCMMHHDAIHTTPPLLLCPSPSAPSPALPVASLLLCADTVLCGEYAFWDPEPDAPNPVLYCTYAYEYRINCPPESLSLLRRATRQSEETSIIWVTKGDEHIHCDVL